MEGSGAEHVRLRLSTAALGPPWQVPEQGPQERVRPRLRLGLLNQSSGELCVGPDENSTIFGQSGPSLKYEKSHVVFKAFTRLLVRLP